VLRIRNIVTVSTLLVSGLACGLMAQGTKKPLTNADVIKMVKAGVPESVVVSSIKSSPANFDVSPDALIALHDAGLTQAEMDAVMAAGKKESSGSSVSATAPGLPSVNLVQGDKSNILPIERTQLVETKRKPTSMASLAADTTLAAAVQAGVNTAAVGAMSHIHSSAAGVGVGQSAGIFGGMLAHRQSSLTYVWAIPNPGSANTSPVSLPVFRVDFSGVPGVNADDFEPAIVRLTPAQNSYRLVGATQGKEDATSNAAVDWQIYSHFLEDRVSAKAEKLRSGQYRLSPTSPLSPGDYGVVLRPVSKTRKFSGGDVERYQGDGILFDSVWSFQVPSDAKPQ
jgi:hypothetical protein